MARYSEKDVPDSYSYPAGAVELQMLSAKHSTEAELDKGDPLLIEVKFEIRAHSGGASAGAKYTERFRLGTKEDPRGESPITRKEFARAGGSWQRWLDLTKKSGVFTGDTEEEVEALNAAKPLVVADMERREGKDPVTKVPNGKFYNSLIRYYEVGKKAVGGGAGASSAGSDKKTCPQCNKVVPAKLFDSHMKRHEPLDNDEEA